MRRGAFVLTIFFLLFTVFSFFSIDGAELVISGNGDGADSEVILSSSSEVNVQQTNTAVIQNTAETSATTGENTASSNASDEVSIQTGSIDTSTTIANNEINTNVAQNKGGETEVVAKILENGSGSENTIDLAVNRITEVTQNNSAYILNNAFTSALTGNNIADMNSGNVEITTGDIRAQTLIQNIAINHSVDPHADTSFIQAVIHGNGSGSSSTIQASFHIDTQVDVFHTADIVNNAVHDLLTGGNSAVGNGGNVKIATGDISSTVRIVNEGINTSFVHLSQAPHREDPGTPPHGGQLPSQARPGESPNGKTLPTEEPITVPTNVHTSSIENHNNGDEGDEEGDVLAAALQGAVLPATGSYLLFLLTLASLICFLTGWYLRLRGGRSPNVAYAFA